MVVTIIASLAERFPAPGVIARSVVLIAFWFLCVNVVYVEGEAETLSRALLAIGFIYGCRLLWIAYRHWLPLVLGAGGVAMLLLAAAQAYLNLDPYVFKAAGNAIWITLFQLPVWAAMARA